MDPDIEESTAEKPSNQDTLDTATNSIPNNSFSGVPTKDFPSEPDKENPTPEIEGGELSNQEDKEQSTLQTDAEDSNHSVEKNESITANNVENSHAKVNGENGIRTPDGNESTPKEAEKESTSQMDENEFTPKEAEKESISQMDENESTPKEAEKESTSEMDENESTPKEAEKEFTSQMDENESTPKEAKNESTSQMDEDKPRINAAERTLEEESTPDDDKEGSLPPQDAEEVGKETPGINDYESLPPVGENGGKPEAEDAREEVESQAKPVPHPHTFHGPTSSQVRINTNKNTAHSQPPLTVDQAAIMVAAQQKLPTSPVKAIVSRMSRHTRSSATKQGRWLKGNNYVDNANYSWQNMSLHADYQKLLYTQGGGVKTSFTK